MSKAEKIIALCLKVDEYLKTINKSLEIDGDNVDDFENHYSELIAETIKANWKAHNLAQKLTSEDFRKLTSHKIEI